jgi:glycosyltransferase involved in cell wall biosynthesis
MMFRQPKWRKLKISIVSLVGFNPDVNNMFESNIDVLQLRSESTGWIKGLFKLFLHLIKHKVKILHSHSSKANIVGPIVGWILRIPFRIVSHHTVWGGYYPLTRLLIWIADHFANYRTFVSYTVKDSYQGKINVSNSIIIYNPVDLNMIKHIIETTNTDDVMKELCLRNEFVIASIGRLIPAKNHLFLLDIFSKFHKKYPNSKLYIIGQGPMESLIKHKISKLNLEKSASLIGYRSDIIRLLKVIDVVVNPSIWEGFSLTTLEAMAAGVPFVGSNIPQYSEAICSGKDGFLINIKDHNRYISVLESVMQNKNKVLNIIQNAKEKVKKFDIHIIANQYYHLYNQFIHSSDTNGNSGCDSSK